MRTEHWFSFWEGPPRDQSPGMGQAARTKLLFPLVDVTQ